MSDSGRPDLPFPAGFEARGEWRESFEYSEADGPDRRRPWTPEMRSTYRSLAQQTPAELRPATLFYQRLVEAIQQAARHQWPLALVVLQLAEPPPDLRRQQALEIALRLDVRETDLPARLSETAFAVLLPQTGATAAVVAARLQHTLANITGRPVTAGLALYPEDATAAEELLQLASCSLMVGPEWVPKPEV